ncbi:MAG: amidohydrolase [Gemmataceae bacterium]
MSGLRRLLAAAALIGVMVSHGRRTDAADEPKPSAGDLPVAVGKRVHATLGDLVAFYKDLHSNPELSLKEVRTAAKLAGELKKLGFTVTTKFGATGVVGVLKNGPGPTVLIRTDMDALPVTEATGLPYASKVRVRDKSDNEVGVMHACGHDIHMSCWVGAARTLVGLKDSWKGTLVFIAQPAEEIGTGARLMLEAGLYDKFPKPDYCLALHSDAQRAHGTVGYTEGLAMANVDSVDILVKGKGGHGATPHMTIDPIVLSARIIMDLQTLVSRETNPVDSAVVTVGSIHGGTKHNIIPNEVKLQITVRSFKESVRKHLLDGIKRIAEGCAKAANAPPPVVTVDPAEFTPALSNDPELTRKTVAVFRGLLGEKNVTARPPLMGGEDFARYAVGKTPVFMWWLGTIDPAKVQRAEKAGAALPSMHSALYYPEPEPSIRVGVTTLTLGAMNLLK